MNRTKIAKILPLGRQPAYDLQVDHPDHNFYCEGLVTSNSHAASYGALSAITIYLKFNYPQQFFIECLRMAQNKQDPLSEMALIQEELKTFGIQLLPPDLVKSEMDFTIEGRDIRFGISAIKGVADKSINNIQDFINKDTVNKFQVFQAAKEAGVNLGIMCALIQAGAMSSMGSNRPLLVLEAQVWGLLTDRERLYALENGEKWDYKLLDMVKEISSWIGANGKPVARATRFDTIKKNYEKYKNIYLANSKSPRFAAYVYEKRLLGYSYSEKLKEIFRTEVKSELISIEDIKMEPDNITVSCIAEVAEVYRSTSQKGWKYMRLTVADETGSCAFMMGGDTLAQYLQKGDIPEEGSFVLINGRKGGDIVWVNRLAVQDYRIYMKLQELEKTRKTKETEKDLKAVTI